MSACQSSPLLAWSHWRLLPESPRAGWGVSCKRRRDDSAKGALVDTRRQAKRVLLQVDMRNAFGTVDCNNMYLLPNAAACYRNAILLGDGYTLESSRGVQQGDVLGPALFVIALQPVVERLRELNLELDMWYQDDGILVGTVDAI